MLGQARGAALAALFGPTREHETAPLIGYYLPRGIVVGIHGRPSFGPTSFDFIPSIVVEFLEDRAPFLAIPRLVEHALSRVKTVEPNSLAEVIIVDQEARAGAARVMAAPLTGGRGRLRVVVEED